MLRSTAAAVGPFGSAPGGPTGNAEVVGKTAQAEAAPASHVWMAHLPGTLSAQAVSERFA
jgi:hypothetical protein